MNLVVGATGSVGTEICRLLIERGKRVRALIRETSDADKVGQLRRLGAALVLGDLKDRPSIDGACRGVTSVISTASATTTRQDGDSLASVDQEGQLGLVDASVDAGVRHFVLVSFPPIDLEFPLQRAKRAVEERLRDSGMTYTILQPTCFTEVWLSAAQGFDPLQGKARMYGSGDNKVSWISAQDVARFAVASLECPHAQNAVVQLGGPDALSPNDVVRLAEQMTGRDIVVESVPEAALRTAYMSATDSLQKSFAALGLYVAGGHVIDMEGTLRTWGMSGLRSVRQHLEVQVNRSQTV